jgi:iron complex outermembrane receptor protein
MELGGHLTDALSFYLTYAWQDFKNKGEEVVGSTSVDQRAEHRIGAGLCYALFENTELLLDYSYQSDEITEVWENEILVGEQEIKAYSVVDFGISQTLFKKAGGFSDGVLSVYTQNLFDEKYYNSTGYPAMDQTFGVSFSLKM